MISVRLFVSLLLSQRKSYNIEFISRTIFWCDGRDDKNEQVSTKSIYASGPSSSKGGYRYPID